jgi:ribosomal protein L22
MADSDEPKTPRRRKAAGAGADASSSSPAKKPPTARSRAAAEKTAGASEKPAAKPARATGKKAATEPPAESKPATTRARAATKRPAADAAAEAKPKRTRAAAKAPAAAAVAVAEAGTATAESRRPARRAAAAKDSVRSVPVGFTVMARARYVRSSARKARLVCDHIRGKSVPEARAVLAFAPRGVAKDWAKLLDSAIANAENNHELVGDELHVTSVYADEGPTLKRFTPRAMGRATPIHKRTSHLTIMLGPKE